MSEPVDALSPEALGFDPEALAQRYREERDRRRAVLDQQA